MTTRLELTRTQIVAFRQRTGSLDERLPAGPEALRRAAWSGLQDSVPRAALHAIHARIEGATPRSWQEPSLVQVWGPRFSAYVVAAEDVAVFTRGRLPERGARRRRADELAARLRDHLDGEAAPYAQAGRALNIDPNQLRYAALTGTVLLRWDGAGAPVVWTVAAPEVDDAEIRLELARRHLHVLGPATAPAYARWAGVAAASATATFDQLGDELLPVRTPIGDAWLLAADEALLRQPSVPPATARLLPSGDPHLLLWGTDRDLVVTDPARRDEVWTARVWPGALLVDGEVAGTWRRSRHTVTLDPFEPLPPAAREAVEAEATTLPVPGVDRPVVVQWVS